MNEALCNRPQYEVFADEYLEHARASFFNAHYDRLHRDPTGFLAIRAIPDSRIAAY